MENVPDRIDKEIFLRAPQGRVFRAISDSRQFGAWFGVAFEAPFEAGKHLTGRMRPTTVDPAIAERQKPYEGRTFDITVERIEPERLFSFRWHPFALDPDVDYSAEPTTLVSFELQEAPGGTLLRISETGFSKIPLARRAAAFSANSGGWAAQTKLIERYLASHHG